MCIARTALANNSKPARTEGVKIVSVRHHELNIISGDSEAKRLCKKRHRIPEAQTRQRNSSDIKALFTAAIVVAGIES